MTDTERDAMIACARFVRSVGYYHSLTDYVEYEDAYIHAVEALRIAGVTILDTWDRFPALEHKG